MYTSNAHLTNCPGHMFSKILTGILLKLNFAGSVTAFGKQKISLKQGAISFIITKPN